MLENLHHRKKPEESSGSLITAKAILKHEKYFAKIEVITSEITQPEEQSPCRNLFLPPPLPHVS